MPDDLFDLIEGRERVTVILVHDVGAPDPELDWLFENAKLVGEREIEGIGAYSFAPRDAERFLGSLRGVAPRESVLRLRAVSEAPASPASGRASPRGARGGS